MQTVSKRVHYSYYDKDGKDFTGHIDLGMKEDDEWIQDSELKKSVKRKWKDSDYKKGDINTVEFLRVE